MKFRLLTLSPVHIGTGEKLQPFEYIIENGFYYRLNQNKAFEILYAEDADFSSRFSDWIEKATRKLSQEKDNKKLSQLINNLNFSNFCSTELRKKELISKILQKAVMYKLASPFGNKGKKEINESLKTGVNELFIPGTSLKGFVRTALLYNALINSPSPQDILEKFRQTTRWKEPLKKRESLDDMLMEDFFFCRSNRKDKFDLLSFLYISDAIPINANGVVLPVNLYLTQKEQQPQTPAVEAIDINSELTTEISFDALRFIRVLREGERPGSKIWLDIRNKFKTLFGFDPINLNEKELEAKTISALLEKIKTFSFSIIEREKIWLKNVNREITNPVLIENFYKKFPSEFPLMRLGWASGFISTTIFNVIYSNPGLKKSFQEIFQKFNIGIPRKPKANAEKIQYSVPNLNFFPKSKRLAFSENKEPVIGFGWVLLLNENQKYYWDFNYNTSDFSGVHSKERPLVAVAEKLSEEEYISRNSIRNYKQGEKVEAKVTANKKPIVYVKLLDSRFTKDFTFKYPAGMPEGQLVQLEITGIQKGVIQSVRFIKQI